MIIDEEGIERGSVHGDRKRPQTRCGKNLGQGFPVRTIVAIIAAHKDLGRQCQEHEQTTGDEASTRAPRHYTNHE